MHVSRLCWRFLKYLQNATTCVRYPTTLDCSQARPDIQSGTPMKAMDDDAGVDEMPFGLRQDKKPELRSSLSDKCWRNTRPRR